MRKSLPVMNAPYRQQDRVGVAADLLQRSVERDERRVNSLDLRLGVLEKFDDFHAQGQAQVRSLVVRFVQAERDVFTNRFCGLAQFVELDHLTEPVTRLRRIDAVRVNRRAFEALCRSARGSAGCSTLEGTRNYGLARSPADAGNQ